MNNLTTSKLKISDDFINYMLYVLNFKMFTQKKMFFSKLRINSLFPFVLLICLFLVSE